MDNEISNQPHRSKIGEKVLDFIFPRFCVGCYNEGNFLCEDCKNKIILIKIPTCIKCQKMTTEGICKKCKEDIPIQKAIIAGYHRDPILREAIHYLKYEGLTELSHMLSKLIIERLNNEKFPKNCTIIPVPLHKSRFSNRGYNQSELIAKKISDHFNIPFETRLLKRIKNTKPQIELKHKERQDNVIDAFCLNKKCQLPVGTIILIDDVITTGATIAECARILRESGTKHIWLIALAHG